MRLLIGRWIGAFTLVAATSFVALAVFQTQASAAVQSSLGATPTPSGVPQFSISPIGSFNDPWFSVTIKPGEQAKLTAAVKNSGAVSATLSTFETNASNPPNGGFAAGTADEKRTGAALWLSYPNESFILAPGETRNVEFSVTVPAATEPGLYVAALVAQTSEPLQIPGSKNFRQIIRSAISVEIMVPGKATSGFVLGTPAFTRETALVRLDVPITNTGTARIRPEGTLTVTTPRGKQIIAAPVKMGSFYGGNTTSVRVLLPTQMDDGEYLISLQLEDAETGAKATIKNVKTNLTTPNAEPKVAASPFVVDQASVTPNGTPVQYADVAATVTNNGSLIPTAKVMLDVKRDGKDIEQYALAQNQALPTGQTKISQRYIPKDGWKPGKWTFQIVVSAVSIGTGTQTVLATVDVPGAITIP